MKPWPAGPPEFPHEAAASVWIPGAPRAFRLGLDICPVVTDASTAEAGPARASPLTCPRARVSLRGGPQKEGDPHDGATQNPRR